MSVVMGDVNEAIVARNKKKKLCWRSWCVNAVHSNVEMKSRGVTSKNQSGGKESRELNYVHKQRNVITSKSK